MKTIKPYRVYLFDIDGTLLSCGDIAGRAAYGALKDEFNLAEIAPFPSFCGRTDRGIIAELFAAEGIEDTDHNRELFLAGYSQRLRQLLTPQSGKPREPIAGVTDALKALQSANASALITIMTGNCAAGAKIKLDGYGLSSFFALERGGYGDDHKLRDDLARATFARLTQSAVNPKPDEILVIGDTVADIACARAIGADCLAVTTGSIGHSELAAAEPKYLAASLTEIKWA